MESVRDVQLTTPNASLFKLSLNLFDGPAIAGNDDVLRSIDGGEGQPVMEAIDVRGHCLFRRANRGHRARSRQCLHQPSTGGDQPESVFKAEDISHARSYIFADTVPQHHVRPDAPTPP